MLEDAYNSPVRGQSVAPKRQSELNQVTDRLNTETTELGKTVSELVSRLESVTRKEPSKPEKDNMVMPCPSTEAACRIDSSVNQLVRIKEIVNKQISLLEV